MNRYTPSVLSTAKPIKQDDLLYRLKLLDSIGKESETRVGSIRKGFLRKANRSSELYRESSEPKD